MDSSQLPIPVASDAHSMTAIRQDHLGARLQANPTFIFPLHINICKTTFSYDHLLPRTLNA